jgi:DNA-binding MarR family transcriptional regulator
MPGESKGGFLISQIKQVQGRVFEKLLKEAGIEEFNGAQGRILYVLWQEDGLPIVELSKRTGLAKTTLTGMLDRMEEQGHISRNYGKADRRRVIITLSDKAKALRGKYESVSAEMAAVFYKGFSAGEIAGFESRLERILKNLMESEETL